MLVVKLRNPMNFPTTRIGNWAVFLPILIAIAGCETTAPTPEPSATTDPPSVVIIPVSIEPELLYQLLAKADTAIKQDQLTFPEESSAYHTYLKILAIEPGQQDAVHGLERLVELYIKLAMHALERGQYATARSMLARGRLIMPNHPSIEPTDEQIRLLSQAQRTRIKLQQDDLQNNPAAISDELQALAQNAGQESCRFIISAKNDAQGRWIYQTLAKGAQATRIRAQIKIRLPAGVERLCFPI
jgi:hypothetical protein